MRISDWSSDGCSSDLPRAERPARADRRRHATGRAGARRHRHITARRIDHGDPAQGSAGEFRARIPASPSQSFLRHYLTPRYLHRHCPFSAAPPPSSACFARNSVPRFFSPFSFSSPFFISFFFFFFFFFLFF